MTRPTLAARAPTHRCYKSHRATPHQPTSRPQWAAFLFGGDMRYRTALNALGLSAFCLYVYAMVYLLGTLPCAAR